MIDFTLPSPPEWMNQGACRDTPTPNDWFPDKGKSDPKANRALCAGCPVINECLQYALTNEIPCGVWGGMGDTERKQLRKKMARNAA